MTLAVARHLRDTYVVTWALRFVKRLNDDQQKDAELERAMAFD
jgi:hypothetical protein